MKDNKEEERERGERESERRTPLHYTTLITVIIKKLLSPLHHYLHTPLLLLSNFAVVDHVTLKIGVCVCTCVYVSSCVCVGGRGSR